MLLSLHNSLRAIFVLIGLSASGPAAAITVFLDPVTQDVTAPAKASIGLHVSGLGNGVAPSLGAFDIGIAFDPAVLMFDDVVFGTFLGDEAGGEAFSGFDDSVAGTVSVDVVSALFDFELDAGQPDAFLLATLEFAPVSGSGTSAVGIASVLLSDPEANILTNVMISSSSEVTVVPEPSSGLLLGAGLLGLLRLRRRSRA